MTQPKLNAIGRPYSPQYDPNYKMRYKLSVGHLRLPYGAEMRFVGDPPREPSRRRKRNRRDVLPLLAERVDESSQAQATAMADALMRVIAKCLRNPAVRTEITALLYDEFTARAQAEQKQLLTIERG